MVFILNESKEIVYVKVIGNKELTVGKRIGIKHGDCNASEGLPTENENEWQWAKDNGFSQILPKEKLKLSPVVDKKPIHVTMITKTQTICNAFPIQKQEQVIVKAEDELLERQIQPERGQNTKLRPNYWDTKRMYQFTIETCNPQERHANEKLHGCRKKTSVKVRPVTDNGEYNGCRKNISYRVRPVTAHNETISRIGIIAISEQNSKDFMRSLISELEQNPGINVSITKTISPLVKNRIGFEVHACGEERGERENKETEWQCVQNNGYTQIAPKSVLQFRPVDNTTIYITIKAQNQVIYDSIPLRNKCDVVVNVIGELVFVRDTRKQKQMIYRYNIKPECKREADNNLKVKIEDIEWEHKKMEAETAKGIEKRTNNWETNRMYQLIFKTRNFQNRYDNRVSYGCREDIFHKIRPASECKKTTTRIGIIAISDRNSEDFVRSLIFELEQNRDINVRYFKVERNDYINRFKLHVYEIQQDIGNLDVKNLRKLHWPEEVAEYYQWDERKYS
ncbi:unnamed protein product [Mytilus coruscus]|uniref:Uncharacterized protein n=1 Tax=Mytilus coruscus TaxID=42192 RepID=A0A6J8C2R1_MYTCO|nr:unnamed protein product [Mytilus coruscus]